MSSWADPPSNIVYAGISSLFTEDSSTRFAIVIRSSSELVNFFECTLPFPDSQEAATEVPILILDKLIQYRNVFQEKIAGIALPQGLSQRCPSLSMKLWEVLDAVPLVIEQQKHRRAKGDQGELATFLGWDEKQMDEQADSMVRKCIRYFGVGHIPLVRLDLHGMVGVDNDFRVHLVDEMGYQRTVDDSTWRLASYYADDLKSRQTKVAFFSMTPHARPDLPTRHALIRLSRCLGVDFKWYVPRPRPQLLPIVRKVENILHCAKTQGAHLAVDEELRILEWVYTTAKRYWLNDEGPLRPRFKGGADVVVISDAILSPLALISKQSDPKRPVIFENRLHVHDWNVNDKSSAEYQTWDFLRARLKDVDLLVCQEPKGLAPPLMLGKNVGYMSPAIDQLDGRTKRLHDWDVTFYGREFNAICRLGGKPVIDYPHEQYILHLAQLVPDEGTLCLLDAYKKFYRRREADSPGRPVPRLLLCYSSSPNNDDSAPVYASIIAHIENTMPELAQSITIIQLRPPDQLWNVLISKAMAIVQLNDSEGIPEILLGAAQKGKPVIVSKNCGYLSFLKEEVGAIVLDGDYTEGIAHNLLRLAADVAHGKDQPGVEGSTALNSRSTTVGNAVSWFYLASKLSKGEDVELGERDVYALAEEDRG
ncbi:putative heat shock trehalose synthase [Aspergillus puulaauensis]|uniref:Trehalose synthase N-terminal domain-containing protein n=1 Tax=Aspergillus puulaauensis TaxID=1220207 RepID=A0A7R7XAB1_9EURO|nr:uncharacterized protein APUU_10466S [Aspergillus puulaauensis]BCS17638.1 hypothetical protein APUU_10466S [Aspergillus puulaauensis]